MLASCHFESRGRVDLVDHQLDCDPPLDHHEVTPPRRPHALAHVRRARARLRQPHARTGAALATILSKRLGFVVIDIKCRDDLHSLRYRSRSGDDRLGRRERRYSDACRRADPRTDRRAAHSHARTQDDGAAANFLDSKRCGETLQSMFTNAVSPELLRVSIHDQIDEQAGDLPCVEAYCKLVGEASCRRTQIESSQISAKNATGPIPARYTTEQRIADEDFCLGIDSHLVFVLNWDDHIVGQWEETGNENAIITVYPKETYFLSDHSRDNYMGLMCRAAIESADFDSMVMYRPVRWIPRTKDTSPRLMSQFAGGLNFGACKPYKEVRNDPHLPFLFFGEEYHRAARLWTHGYDFYVPSVDIVFHYNEDRKRTWDLDWENQWPILYRSRRRARYILGLPVSSDDFDHEELDKYALGTKRTFDQWKQFSGIDPLANWTDKTENQFDNCEELVYVPFNE